ncbi:hypothetical protein [Bradyrhizobium sp. AZCC 1693]|uniref:hypothetical protein n=1 Tax=Bradyrhizobium sp. AZCC 1693 TaxID=3117029 RepID=UPI002FEFA9C2
MELLNFRHLTLAARVSITDRMQMQLVWVLQVTGSNPVAPTNNFNDLLRIFRIESCQRSQLGRGRGILVTGRKTAILARQALLLGLALCLATTVLSRTAAANPAQMISDFRLKHGEQLCFYT